MADIRPSCIVQSVAGHDRGGLFLVLRTEGDFAALADGRLRKCSRPKRKRMKHLLLVAEDVSPVAQRITQGESVSDSEVRKALAPYRAASPMAKGGN